jgi:elongation factor P hydroxylase
MRPDLPLTDPLADHLAAGHAAPPTVPAARPHRPADLQALFDGCFAESLDTVLRGGFDEPLYRAPTGGECAQIQYAHDHFASALHEVAHWLVAGPERRRLDDYGYWYVPDGRDPEQQAAFEQVEVRPQALEWCLSEACGFPFRLSSDNVEAGGGPSVDFARAVTERRRAIQDRLPPRAARLVDALRAFYGTQQQPGSQPFFVAS